MKLMKTLFVWLLLLLALPLQGYAAAALNFCSSGSAPPRAQAHCHIVSAKSDHSLTHDATGANADAGHCQDASSSHKCSNCSFCAFGAACVPTSTPPLAARPAGAERIDYLPHYVTSRLPAGLERPPHSLSA
jgi:hypothetical protein